MDTPEPHDAMRPMAALLGVFEGSGRGDYPTIEPFAYRERATFSQTGRPFFAYQQQTWRPDRDVPMHAEVGYLRAPSAGRAELVLAQPTGLVEVDEGTFEEGVLDVASTSVAATATAKVVEGVRRRFVIAGDTLTYELWMCYAGVRDALHLRAELERVR